MDSRTNEKLQAIKHSMVNKTRKWTKGPREIIFIPLEYYMPDVKDEHLIRAYARMCGYQVRYDRVHRVPMLFNIQKGKKNTRHGYIQKHGDTFYLVKGDKQTPLVWMDELGIKVVDMFRKHLISCNLPHYEVKERLRILFGPVLLEKSFLKAL